jgi:pyruvate-formate lyase-activating enzyme
VAPSDEKYLDLWGSSHACPNPKGLELHVSVTSWCDRDCAFCTHKESKNPQASMIDKHKWFHDMFMLSTALKEQKKQVSKVFFTGGEPLSMAATLSELVNKTKVFFPQAERHLMTNGSFPIELSLILEEFHSVYVTRLLAPEEDNIRAMGSQLNKAATSPMTLADIGAMPNKGKVIITCPVHAGGIDSPEGLSEYLEAMASNGIENVKLTSVAQGPFGNDKYIPLADLELENLPGLRLSRRAGNEDALEDKKVYLYSSSRGELLTVVSVQPLEQEKEPFRLVYDKGGLKPGFFAKNYLPIPY